MAQEFSRGFYNSKVWYRTRNAYYKAKGGLCEECYRNGLINEGEIVHHKIHLTPDNIDNPLISLDWNNLELLCRECHEKIHNTKPKKRYQIDGDGNVLTEISAEAPLFF